MYTCVSRCDIARSKNQGQLDEAERVIGSLDRLDRILGSKTLKEKKK